MKNTKVTSISWQLDLLAKIDEKRGKLDRSKFVNDQIARAMNVVSEVGEKTDETK